MQATERSLLSRLIPRAVQHACTLLSPQLLRCPTAPLASAPGLVEGSVGEDGPCHQDTRMPVASNSNILNLSLLILSSFGFLKNSRQQLGPNFANITAQPLCLQKREIGPGWGSFVFTQLPCWPLGLSPTVLCDHLNRGKHLDESGRLTPRVGTRKGQYCDALPQCSRHGMRFLSTAIQLGH